MLTDVILREATADVERFLLSIVPETGEAHVFSNRFEWKMRKLIRRTNHPIRYQAMRIAAAVVLAIVTLFGAVMAVSPDARAAVARWFKGVSGNYVEYYRNPDTNYVPGDDHADNVNKDNNTVTPPTEPVKYEYRLSSIPEGYRELRVIDGADRRTYMYINNTGTFLSFSYTYGMKTDSVYIEAENYSQYTAAVNGVSADIYIADTENETSVIIWQDPYSGALFQITALADQAELIQLAETVEKIEK